MQELINKYINLIEKDKNNGEIYKWKAITNFQDNWNVEADNFYTMFKKAFSKKSNLMYQISYGFLDKLGKSFPNDLKELFSIIYNESDSFEKRYEQYVKKSNEFLYKLKKSLNNKNIKHQQDERTLSFLLTLKNPEKYYLYKDNIYKVFCEYNKVEPKPSGQKYVHFSQLANSLLNIVSVDSTLQELTHNFIPNNFNFNSDKLIVQDIIYRTLVQGNKSETKRETSEIKKEFLTSLMTQLQEKLRENNHPLANHSWIQNNSDNYRQISIFEKGKKPNVGLIHYEFMIKTHGIYIELHPEGSKENKEHLINLINEISNNKHTLVNWKHAITGKYDNGKYKKIESKNYVPIPNDFQINDEFVEKVQSLLIDFYDDCNTKLCNFYNQNKTLDKSKNLIMNIPLNQILFGPPGTGKTYHTINKALEIIDQQFLNENINDREVLTNQFKNYIEDGRIVFTTFHQSMSYEDFVEGIKPETENGVVSYDIESGIFKNICLKARINPKANFSEAYNSLTKEIINNDNEYLKLFTKTKSEFWINVNSKRNLTLYTTKNKNQQGTLTKEKLEQFSNGIDSFIGWEGYADGIISYLKKKHQLFVEDIDFNTLHSSFIKHVKDQLKSLNKTYFVPLKLNGKFLEIINVIDDYIVTKGNDSENEVKIEKEKLRLLFNKYESINDIKNINDDIRSVGTGLGWSSNYYGVFKELKKFQHTYSNSKPVVLIIDEINRGNVSAIFGELITLIEEDKRKGGNEEIEVVLPYSKEPFSVPDNLYIIGTMNTADRSVEALDSALRRRFSFEEIAPKPDLISEKGDLKDVNGIITEFNINLSEILTVINRRIEKLIDKDHKIGHSYFLSISNVQDLKNVFQKNIIPLLQEYFFGDFGKIGLVIGSGFYISKENEINEDNFFAEVEDFDFGGLYEKKTYDFINVSNMKDDKFKEAIDKLLRN